MELISVGGAPTAPTRPKLRLRQQSRRFRIKTGSQSQLPVIPALFAFGNTATLAALAAAGSGFLEDPGPERLTPRPLAPASTRSRLPPPEVGTVAEETPAEEQLPPH